MITKFAARVMVAIDRLRSEEEGLALTEYLILLGLLTAAVIGAVLAFGLQLGVRWQSWATWLLSLTGAPPPIT